MMIKCKYLFALISTVSLVACSGPSEIVIDTSGAVDGVSYAESASWEQEYNYEWRIDRDDMVHLVASETSKNIDRYLKQNASGSYSKILAVLEQNNFEEMLATCDTYFNDDTIVEPTDQAYAGISRVKGGVSNTAFYKCNVSSADPAGYQARYNAIKDAIKSIVEAAAE